MIRFRNVLANVCRVPEEAEARRKRPELYGRLHAACLPPPPRELAPEEEERIADRVAHRLEAHLLFPPERADREFREALRLAAGRPADQHEETGDPR
ncbi:hypothetical protein [Streptomyces synnematoformans]|uniref:Uncharacterized protein n=1 Tax=Streptomyces synnematoformans TaxID=415721 RepID=A0ABN2YSB4_9ACTN